VDDVAWNPRSWRFDAHPAGAVDFLHGWLSGDITTTVFGDANTTNPWFA
jgi:hypothetical protein